MVRERAKRRHVRLLCKLQTSTSEVGCFSHNLSATGVYVRVPRSQADTASIEPHTLVAISIVLSGSTEPVTVKGEIVWTEPRDRDVNGAPVLGVALQFVDVPIAIREQLASFTRDFRYTVLCV